MEGNTSLKSRSAIDSKNWRDQKKAEIGEDAFKAAEANRKMKEGAKENVEQHKRRLNKRNERYDKMIANESESEKKERLSIEAAKKREFRKRKKESIQEQVTSTDDNESDYEKLRQSNINEIKKKVQKLGLKVMFKK